MPWAVERGELPYDRLVNIVAVLMLDNEVLDNEVLDNDDVAAG